MQLLSGLTTCTFGSSVVVYGGRQSHTVTHLDLLTLLWHVDATEGPCPRPCLFHAAATDDRCMYVCGGLTLAEAADSGGLPRPLATIPYKAFRPMKLFRLDLATLEWSLLHCSGDAPTDRSHHSLSVLHNSHLLVVGGKPIGQTFTQNQLAQFDQVAFFSPFILDFATLTWRRVDLPVPLPRLWGHAAAVVETATSSPSPGAGGGPSVSNGVVALHGGFQIVLERSVENGEAAPSDLLPYAELNASVVVVNVDLISTTVVGSGSGGDLVVSAAAGFATEFAPRREELVPPPCALHNAVFRSRMELLVFGGVAVDAATGTTLSPSLEMWSWTPSSGLWRPAPFCYDDDLRPPPPPYPFAKFVAATYGGALVVVAPNGATVNLYDGVRWREMECDCSCFQDALSPFSAENVWVEEADRGRSREADAGLLQSGDSVNDDRADPTQAGGGGSAGAGNPSGGHRSENNSEFARRSARPSAGRSALSETRGAVAALQAEASELTRVVEEHEDGERRHSREVQQRQTLDDVLRRTLGRPVSVSPAVQQLILDETLPPRGGGSTQGSHHNAVGHIQRLALNVGELKSSLESQRHELRQRYLQRLRALQ